MEDLVATLRVKAPRRGHRFSLNVDLKRQFWEAVPHDIKKAVLDAVVLWDGMGWNTSKASKKLWDVAGIGLVSGDVNKYNDAFVYSMALAWKIEVPQLTLCRRGFQFGRIVDWKLDGEKKATGKPKSACRGTSL